MCKIMAFPFFQNFDILGCYGGKMAKNDKFLSASLCISGTLPHMIVVISTHV